MGDELKAPSLEPCDRLDPGEWYMESAGRLWTMRGGEVVELTGVELERVRRWKLRR